MRQKPRMWVVNTLTVIMLVSNALITPGTVLCIGPGHHCGIKQRRHQSHEQREAIFEHFAAAAKSTVVFRMCGRIADATQYSE